MINPSSNAVIIKIRARYAKRLGTEDYNNLTACSSLPEIVSYLKGKRIYCDSLSKINDKKIHRSDLESVLNRNFYEDLSVLAKYDLNFGQRIFRYILTKFEIQQIGKFLIFLKSGNAKKFECLIPAFLKSRSRVKFDKFNSAESYGDLVESMSNTNYYQILKSNKSEINYFDINKIETGLYNHLFGIFSNSISNLNSRSKKKINDFFHKCVDISNVIRIVRSKKFFNSDDEYINSITFKFGDYKFSKYDVLSKSNFSNFDFIDEDIQSVRDLEKFSKIIRFKWSKKNIRYSNISEVVGFSYVFLKEIEISNIINIIEGIRYGLKKENIENTLII